MANQAQSSSKDIEIHQNRMNEILQTLSAQSRSAEFARALVENSNLEMEWRWVATTVSSALEAEYCYHQALVIWPESQEAKQGLAALKTAPTGNTEQSPTKTGTIFGFGRQAHSTR